jgi:hypothetical protein
MTTIRRHPTATSYSIHYQRDLLAAKAEILLALRYAELPLPRLVWQARNAYQRAWAAELERVPDVG